MSRAYRIQWRTASRRITAEDEVSIDVALLGILSEEEMRSLLDAELIAEGWHRKKGTLVRDFDGATAEIDAERKTVTIHVERTSEVTARGHTDDEAKHKADAHAKQSKAQLDGQVVAEIAEAEAAVRESMQGALQKVYVTALEAKARKMGEVESIDRRENEDGELELIIKVKV